MEYIHTHLTASTHSDQCVTLPPKKITLDLSPALFNPLTLYNGNISYRKAPGSCPGSSPLPFMLTSSSFFSHLSIFFLYLPSIFLPHISLRNHKHIFSSITHSSTNLGESATGKASQISLLGWVEERGYWFQLMCLYFLSCLGSAQTNAKRHTQSCL